MRKHIVLEVHGSLTDGLVQVHQSLLAKILKGQDADPEKVFDVPRILKLTLSMFLNLVHIV